MIDAYWISLIVAVGGAFCGMVFPYIIKTMEEDGIKFEMGYFYSLIVSAVIAAVALIPAEIALSPQYYVSLFLAGIGVQTVVAKGNTELKKKKKKVQS